MSDNKKKKDRRSNRFYSGMVNDIAYEIYHYYKTEIEQLKST